MHCFQRTRTPAPTPTPPPHDRLGWNAKLLFHTFFNSWAVSNKEHGGAQSLITLACALERTHTFPLQSTIEIEWPRPTQAALYNVEAAASSTIVSRFVPPPMFGE